MKCEKCGRKLNYRNKTGECYSHSVPADDKGDWDMRDPREKISPQITWRKTMSFQYHGDLRELSGH